MGIEFFISRRYNTQPPLPLPDHHLLLIFFFPKLLIQHPRPPQTFPRDKYPPNHRNPSKTHTKKQGAPNPKNKNRNHSPTDIIVLYRFDVLHRMSYALDNLSIRNVAKTWLEPHFWLESLPERGVTLQIGWFVKVKIQLRWPTQSRDCGISKRHCL